MSNTEANAAPTPKPLAPKPADLRTIPAFTPFIPCRIWVNWQYEWVVKKDGTGGKWTKVPKQPRGYNASSTKPATWSNFEPCWKKVEAGLCDGIGLMLLGLPGNKLAAADLDKCRDPQTGIFLPWADKLIRNSGSYAEVTPSGAGARLLGTTSAIKTIHRNAPHPDGGGFELFINAARFITATGQTVNGVDTLADISPQFTELAALLDKEEDGDSGGERGNAGQIEPKSLPAHIAELIIHGTENRQPVSKRGPAFMRVVAYLKNKHTFADVLASLRAYPNGVQAKYPGNRLETELRRAWDKITPRNQSSAPTVQVVSGQRHLAADAGLAALATTPFYQRDRTLVRIAHAKAKASDGTELLVPAVMPVNTAILTRALGGAACWEKIKANGEIVAIDPPKEVVEQIAAMTDNWPFPALRGLIDTPTLRPDGSLLQTAGYDQATGYVLFNPPPMQPIPDQPTKRDALDALSVLNTELLDEFPFVDNAARSVALSLLLTPVLRAAMPVVPMHVITKPEAGTGGSYLVDIASAIATGERCAVMAVSDNKEETEKRLIGAALAQFPIISLDNVNGLLFGDFLCQATERPVMRLRPLGTSNMMQIANTFTVFANGNNLTISADAVRRCVQCKLDADMETPEERTFSADPVRRVLADRGRYIRACLVIARAYHCAGLPGRLPPRASYEAWSDLVRSALVWLNWSDPVDTVADIRTDDPVRAQRRDLFTAWEKELQLTVGYRTAELIAKAEEWTPALKRSNPELFAALHAVAASRHTTGQIDAKRLGEWLQ